MAGQADFSSDGIRSVKLRFKVETPLADPRGALHFDCRGAAVTGVAGRVGQLRFPQFFLASVGVRVHG